MSVLVVDGDNLLTIGFHGMKNYFYKGKHIGGIYYFINTLRRMFDSHQVQKIVVFWDGENSSSLREEIYPEYKQSRKNKKQKTEEEINSFQYQKERVQLYLEEIFVRQGEYGNCESDDCIAQYISESDEDIIIVSSDGDMTQLVKGRIKMFNPIHQTLYQEGDKYVYKKIEFPIENVILIKILCGDDSDDITGLKNIGIKRLLNFFPEIIEKPVDVEYIINQSKVLNEVKSNWVLNNIINGISKTHLMGELFYETNKKLILLNNTTFITNEAIESIHSIVNDMIDPEGRSYKNAMKLMIEDGIHLVLPKNDSAWVNFLNPFLSLTRKEKNKQKRILKVKK